MKLLVEYICMDKGTVINVNVQGYPLESNYSFRWNSFGAGTCCYYYVFSEGEGDRAGPKGG